MTQTKKVTGVDLTIGDNIRTKRLECGFTRFEVAEQLGITQQQLHKIEVGKNRVPASRLIEIANILQTNIAWFYGKHKAYKENQVTAKIMQKISGLDPKKQSAVLNVVTAMEA